MCVQQAPNDVLVACSPGSTLVDPKRTQILLDIESLKKGDCHSMSIVEGVADDPAFAQLTKVRKL